VLGEKDGSEVLAESYIVKLNDIASATLTSAYTQLTGRVETTKEILDIWSKIRDMEIVHDNNEYLVTLLVTSRINDLRKEIEHPADLKAILDNFYQTFLNMEPNTNVSKADLAAAYLTIGIVSQTPEI
jgi:hypothetical protein